MTLGRGKRSCSSPCSKLRGTVRWRKSPPSAGAAAGRRAAMVQACSLEQFNIRFDIDDPMPENFRQIIRVVRLKLGGPAA